MSKNFWTVLWVLLATMGIAQAKQTLNLRLSRSASSIERIAASDFANIFPKLYPDIKCTVGQGLADYNVIVGTKDALPQHTAYAEASGTPEGFSVSKLDDHTLLILGNDRRGTGYGVYRYLKQHGVLYTLDEDIALPQNKSFSFAGVNFESVPKLAHRPMLNWHNMLSGCTSWDLPKWKRYIEQCHKMGMNELIVHAYPYENLLDWEYKGYRKKNEFIPYSRHSAPWGVHGLTDVRDLHGGDLFNQDRDYFGTSIADLPTLEEQKIANIQLTHAFMNHAKERGMDINLIFELAVYGLMPEGFEKHKTKDPNAFFKDDKGENLFPNVTTAEGRDYIRALFKAILTRFPQLTDITINTRGVKNKPDPRTALQSFSFDDYPAEWKAEFEQKLPVLEKLSKEIGNMGVDPDKAFPLVAMKNTLEATQVIVADLGREIEWHYGSWHFYWITAANEFIPKAFNFIGFDYEGKFLGRESRLKLVRHAAESGRRITPLYWPQNDDFSYIGRSFTPSTEAVDRVAESKVTGFGVLHWMTHPFDIWFGYCFDDLWSETADRTMEDYISDYSARIYGEENAKAVAGYFNAWINDAPQFGRETGAHMMDLPNWRKLNELDPQLKVTSEQRLKQLDTLEKRPLTPEQLNRLRYFRQLERFSIKFLEAHYAQEKAMKLREEGKDEEARKIMATLDEVAVVKDYVEAMRCHQTEGEMSVLVSLHSRWLQYLNSTRSVLGMEPHRVNFVETRGQPTYTYDEDKKVWHNIGEGSGRPKPIPTDRDEIIFSEGIVVDENGISFKTLPQRERKFPAGTYTLTIHGLTDSDKGNLEIRVNDSDYETVSLASGEGLVTLKHTVTTDKEEAMCVYLKSDTSIVLLGCEILKHKN